MTAAERWGAPWHGLSDSRVIKTEAMLRAEVCIASVLEHRGILQMSGPSGSGKTFSAARALAAANRPSTYSLFDGQATPKEVARLLLVEATGCEYNPRTSYYMLRDECIRVFRDPIALVIDEAQHLQSACMGFLRQLHDNYKTDVSIILIGTEGLRRKIADDETLASRARSCPFQPVKLDVLLRAIPKFHPIYTEIEPADIQRIHDRYAGGDLRRWAEFAITAIDVCAGAGESKLDHQTISASLAQLAPYVR